MSGWYGPKSRLWRIWQICTWSEFWIIKTVDVSCNCSANAVDTVFLWASLSHWHLSPKRQAMLNIGWHNEPEEGKG